MKDPTDSQGSWRETARELIANHALHVGRVTIAWNALQATQCEMFARMVTPSDHKMGYALWHTLRSDRSQREMLANALKHRLQHRPKPLEEFKWFLGKMPGLEDRRNDVVHAPHGIEMDFDQRKFRMFPDTSSGHKLALNLVNKDFSLECTSLVQSLDELSKWVKQLEVIALLNPTATGDEELPPRPIIQKPAHPGQ